MTYRNYGKLLLREAFENQVFVEELFRPIRPLGFSELWTLVERRFLNASIYRFRKRLAVCLELRGLDVYRGYWKRLRCFLYC